MNEINNLSTQLPSTQGKFVIDLKGDVTKMRFEGEFTCKIPTLKTTAQISKYQVLLNGGLEESLDLGVLQLHKMIAYLKYCVITAPKFWSESEDGYELLDFNIVEAVYAKALEFENSWAKAIWGEKVEAPKDKAANE